MKVIKAIMPDISEGHVRKCHMRQFMPYAAVRSGLNFGLQYIRRYVSIRC